MVVEGEEVVGGAVVLTLPPGEQARARSDAARIARALTLGQATRVSRPSPSTLWLNPKLISSLSGLGVIVLDTWNPGFAVRGRLGLVQTGSDAFFQEAVSVLGDDLLEFFRVQDSETAGESGQVAGDPGEVIGTDAKQRATPEGSENSNVG